MPLGQGLQQLEAVSNLHRVGRPGEASREVGDGVVTGVHLGAGVLAQPGCEGNGDGGRSHAAEASEVWSRLATPDERDHRPGRTAFGAAAVPP